MTEITRTETTMTDVDIDTIQWGDDLLRLTIALDADGRARLTGLVPIQPGSGMFDTALPLVELVTAARSKLSGGRFDNTDLGLDLRYLEHRESVTHGVSALEVDLRDPLSSLRTTVRYTMRMGSGVLSASTRVWHSGDGAPVALLFVSSFALGDSAWACADTTVHLADSDWLAESRWSSGTFAALGEPEINMAAHAGAPPRGTLNRLGRGTWSSGEQVPMGALERTNGSTLLWQVESNGGWRWQLSQSAGTTPTGVLRLVTSGPTDVEHQWSVLLGAGDSFVTPVTSIAWSADGFDGALARLTDHRRADRRRFDGDAGLPVIYNDYMNTLMADPTTEKLLPLIDAVGRTGAEIFVVDAGWYSDEAGWWETVGAWEASTTRFSGGITEIFDAIRANGMIPGLWLEPEVVGVDSPVAAALPDEAFFMRYGTRLIENGRYQLDFRHPAVIERMDAVLDRLIADYGIGYVKFDYNINPASGTERLASSPGDGLLAAMRAFLDWVDGVHDRHPNLIIEDCASGGMRSDWHTVSHFALLSTSDQQDALRCVPIAASSPTLVPPEQAGVWSYPQAGMSAAVTTITLANSLLRRPILSGHLDRMNADELAVVTDFISVHKRLRAALPELHSTWPLGLPSWDDAWVAAGLTGANESFLVVWRRAGGSPSCTLPLGRLLKQLDERPEVEQLFPAFPTGTWTVDGDSLEVVLDEPSAVVLRFH